MTRAGAAFQIRWGGARPAVITTLLHSDKGEAHTHLPTRSTGSKCGAGSMLVAAWPRAS